MVTLRKRSNKRARPRAACEEFGDGVPAEPTPATPVATPLKEWCHQQIHRLEDELMSLRVDRKHWTRIAVLWEHLIPLDDRAR